LEHVRQPRVVAHAAVQDADGGFEQLHAGAEGGDAALEGGVGRDVHVLCMRFNRDEFFFVRESVARGGTGFFFFYYAVMLFIWYCRWCPIPC
jgi:hypothetical protein